MLEIICNPDYIPKEDEQYITFFDLLLDDTLANADIICPKEVYEKVGNLNTRLNAKQHYEFLLRVRKEYPVRVVNTSKTSEASDVFTFSPSEGSPWEEFRTDCYVAGKYAKELLDAGYFNPVIETLLLAARQLSNPDTAAKWLENMLSHSPEFYEIDDNTRPILIYRGDDTCYNQLNTFADKLAEALIHCHQRVEIFDVSTEGVGALTRYRGQHFKAIVGIQTYLFSVKMQDKTTNLHDLIIGPKFNMILDHPVLLKEHIVNGPKDYYLLIHDRNYLKFAKKYYKNVVDCFFFPPAGILTNSASYKNMDVSFIGTYYNYRNILAGIKTMNKDLRFIARRFLSEMKYNPNLPAETALERVLSTCQISVSENEFLDLLFELRYVFFGVMYYYREKVIRTLLESGIEVNVYGSSWDSSLFTAHPKLKRHPQVTGEESLQVMLASRISLNIMAWHKDGFTERIANAMLNHSVVVSDKSTLLAEWFASDEELILFDLENLSALPDKIKTLLASPERLLNISQQGYLKASKDHLWENRALQLLDILDAK